MSFWTEKYSGAGVNDPKRSFRFRVQFTQMAELTGYSTDYLFYAKTADKPSFQVGSVEHDFLNHKFKFPGKVTWQTVTIAMVDPGPDTNGGTGSGVAFGLTTLLQKSGYSIPAGVTSQYQTISKTKAVSGLGDVIIEQLDADGNPIEKWTLYNAFITDVKFGSLDYSSEDLTQYDITLDYDWAEYDGVDFVSKT